MVTLYYRDDTVQVTSESLRAGERIIPISEVTYVWHARGPATARDRTRRLGRGVLIFLLSIPPLVAIVCGVSLVYAAHDTGEWLLVATIVAVCAVGVLILTPLLELPLGWLDRSYDRGVRSQELWVQYRGQKVMLLRTSDALRFGRIYRAVQRAVEQRDDLP